MIKVIKIKNGKRIVIPAVIVAVLALAGISYADYYLSDGTLVKWAGGNQLQVVRSDGSTETVTGTRNSDGRLVPSSGISNSQRSETNLLGSQNTGGDSRFNQNTGVSVPVFTNGQLTGYSNIYQDSSGLGRTYYTQNNGAGSVGSTVISGQNGGSADFNWSRVDLTSPTATPTSSYNPPSNTYSPPSYSYTPPAPPPPPPTNLLRTTSIEHNSAWEDIRNKHSRSQGQFYSGEKFVVKATATHDATSVSVSFNFPQATQDVSPAFQESPNQARPNFAATYQLTKQNTYDWSGTFWRKAWVGIPDGTYSAVITTVFQNGQTRTATHSIQIQGSILDFADGIEKIHQ